METKEMTIEELEVLKAQIEGEIKSRSGTVARYATEFGSYNDRRYSKPWIAKVISWPVGGRPNLEFGRYIGNDDGGEVEIMACPGDIIRVGQKDLRQPRRTQNDWFVARDNGVLEPIEAAEARKLYNQ